MAPAIELDGRRPGLRRAGALAGVTLTLEPGRTLAVFGANGAGKTTLLRILATLLRPHAGRARVLGRDAAATRAGRCAGGSGCSAHEPLLYRELSARENLRFHARLHDVAAASASRRCSTRSGCARAPTSRCARSRAAWRSASAICRAVLHEPELLLLDEPLANLDPGAAEAVEPLIGRGAGPARVVISHDVEAGLAEADVVLGLRAGPRRRCSRRGGAVGRGRRAGLYRVRRGGRRALVRKDLLLELRTARVGAGDGRCSRSRPSCSSTSRSTARRSRATSPPACCG